MRKKRKKKKEEEETGRQTDIQRERELVFNWTSI